MDTLSASPTHTVQGDNGCQSRIRRALGSVDVNVNISGVATSTSEKANSLLQRVVTFDDDCADCNVDEIIAIENQNNVNDEEALVDAKTRFDAVAATRVSQYVASPDDSFDEFTEWSLEDFELIRKLGEGGAATVYEAREVQSGYTVALKAQKAQDYLAESEIDIHESVEHANIVGFYDYFYSDSFFGTEPTKVDSESYTLPGRRYVYTILELCTGGSLYDVVRSQSQGCLKDECQAASWIKDAMQALEHIHSRDILHCDVKTANFVVSDSGKLKLTDFGFSARREEEGLEVEGGSLFYMAPEHLMAWRDGQTFDNLDEGIDVYGLGVVLFEILVGEVPYIIVEDHSENIPSNEDTTDFASCWEGSEFPPQTIELEALDETCKLPALIIPGFLSDEVHDLLKSLLQPDPQHRISIESALCHPWIQKHSSC